MENEENSLNEATIQGNNQETNNFLSALAWNDGPMALSLVMNPLVNLEGTDEVGNNTLHLAARHPDLFAELVSLIPGNILNLLKNAQNNAGQTPLHVAIEAGSVNPVSFLLNSGVDTTISTWSELTAGTVHTTNQEIIRLLERVGVRQPHQEQFTHPEEEYVGPNLGGATPEEAYQE